MPLLTVPAQQPDYIALAMVGALLLGVVAVLLHKRFGPQTCGTVSNPKLASAPRPMAPGSAGQLKLHSVEPKTAAMIMAIVAEKTGRPLNELRFISIKEVNGE